MKLHGNISTAIRDIMAHRFRSALTALGIIFGCASVVTMMAISEGAQREAIRQIESMGIDNLVIRSAMVDVGQQGDGQSQSWLKSYGVTSQDMIHIREKFENVKSTAAIRELGGVVYDHQSRMTDIKCFAATPSFMEVTRTRVIPEEGRALSELDEKQVNQVCVIGKEAARKVFSYNPPVGRTVTVCNEIFRVVGVIENPDRLKLPGGYDINNQIFVPFETANRHLGKIAHKQSGGASHFTKLEADLFYIQIKDVNQIGNILARLRSFLKTTHEEKDYEIIAPFELLKQKRQSERIFKIVLACIAGMSLLTGGIGIMNIMMANVYERKKEIGTHRALGATQLDILTHFLFESLFLCLLGGVSGVAVGVGLALGVQHYAEMEIVITHTSIIISLGLSFVVGLIFGTYPAQKAASMDPIEALRTE
ncbi:ABC transporter permease [Candidatus Sumerlaeota bacterium]|nr:ABC transporter permease [Candidatus Sumerlaeota bacterium]